ncbi:MAG: CaiB/BaiF CoA-transferase family protein [Myxococcaceae bacterium]|nr:CaiB/BaiF CoA-transferase family protein [Myxococcaceae bacterium]
MSLPLEGLKVLDLSRLLPGPYATLVLADLGATVDKVEEPQGGDYTRHMPPMKGEVSALFLALNRNKRSLTLDLKSPEGVSALKRLAARYDVLVESFRPGVMDKLGVGFEALAKENPRLIYCSISGYGATGPDRLKAGHDLNYIARSGALAYGGVAGGPPAMPGVQMADIGGGSLFALVGILAALHERQRTGQGRFVDISMTEGSLAFLHMHLGARLMMGAESGPLQRGAEALNGGYACYGLYRTQDDRWLAVGSLEPKFFGGLCEVLERPDLMPGGYDTGAEGRATRRELEALFAAKPLAHWVELFRRHDLCIEPVNEGDEVLNDPQLVARGMFVKAGDVMHLKTPLHFGPMPTRDSPGLGAHTDEVLREAGFSDDERRALVSSR